MTQAKFMPIISEMVHLQKRISAIAKEQQGILSLFKATLHNTPPNELNQIQTFTLLQVFYLWLAAQLWLATLPGAGQQLAVSMEMLPALVWLQI